jgi:hypothetical protein
MMRHKKWHMTTTGLYYYLSNICQFEVYPIYATVSKAFQIFIFRLNRLYW